MPRTLAVVGTGLIGASVGLAAHRAGGWKVSGWDPDPDAPGWAGRPWGSSMSLGPPRPVGRSSSSCCQPPNAELLTSKLIPSEL